MYFGRGQTADILSYVAGLAQTNKFSSGTTVFDICQHSTGKKVSIGRFKKIISFFFVEAFNRNHSLGLQYGFYFLLRYTIQVVVPVKQNDLTLVKSTVDFPNHMDICQ